MSLKDFLEAGISQTVPMVMAITAQYVTSVLCVCRSPELF